MTGSDKPARTPANSADQPNPVHFTNAETQAVPQPDPRMLRLMKTIVIILGVLIVLALIALVAGIIMKGVAFREAGSTPLTKEIGIPSGTTIQALSIARGELAVVLHHPDGMQEILVIDTQRSRILRRFHFKPAPTKKTGDTR